MKNEVLLESWISRSTMGDELIVEF